MSHQRAATPVLSGSIPVHMEHLVDVPRLELRLFVAVLHFAKQIKTRKCKEVNFTVTGSLSVHKTALACRFIAAPQLLVELSSASLQDLKRDRIVVYSEKDRARNTHGFQTHVDVYTSCVHTLF